MYAQQCVEKFVKKVTTFCIIESFGVLNIIVFCLTWVAVHGEWRYFRSCAYMGEPGIVGDERFCLMRTGTFNIFMEYCTCNSKDGCNTAGLNKPPPLRFIFITTICLALCTKYLL